MPAELTPMMRKYMEVKEKYKDCILFYRLGDFYEMFFEDALLASRELEIVLTGRDCGLEERAPMCGVPYHAVEIYASKLIEKGYKVAICEQMTDPKESKGLVEREVIRVMTPGTVIEESMLSERKNNYIVSVFLRDSDLGLAYCDVSTGAFYVYEYSGEKYTAELMDELCRIQPTEIVANDAIFLNELLTRKLQSEYYTQCYGNWAYEYTGAKQRLLNHFGVSTLSGFGCDDMPCAISAAGALIAYLEDTQKNSLCHIKRIRVMQRTKYMHIDANSRRNLELTQPLRADGSKKNTLLYLLDKTGTAMGGRLLRTWIDQPLQDPGDIDARLNAVDELLSKPIQRQELMTALDAIYDIERLCSRIAYSTVHARDCDCLRHSLEKLPGVITTLQGLKANEFQRIHGTLDPMDDICALLTSAIIDNPPLSVKDGGIIRDGYNEELDKYRDAAKNGKTWLARMEAEEREKTGIKNLRISYNKVFGYYIEVSNSFKEQVPETYIRKQTLVNGERYITQELKDLEHEVLTAHDRDAALEYDLFAALRTEAAGQVTRVQLAASLIAQLDTLCAFAEVAAQNHYCRPEVDESGVIEITAGRHPVVEKVRGDAFFVPNDTHMGAKEDRVAIITGPNMAGKSTYMRQVALIVLMAQVGCFVPAQRAHIGVVDRIFTRIGASDDLAAGQSTFMVEMTEVSELLRCATKNSLLILDEIGRGTSTFDGMSIARAVLEHCAGKLKAKTLFATHYHELTTLEQELPNVRNYNVAVHARGEDIVFLRKIVPGGADRSYGIEVAKLAGLPDTVLKRAQEILRELESQSQQPHTPAAREDQVSLEGMAEGAVADIIRRTQVDALSPLEALNLLYELKSKLQ